MPRMTDEEAFAFIAAQPRTGKLAVVRRDGSPHVVPIWVAVGPSGRGSGEVDGRSVLFNCGEESIHGKALRRDPRASLCVDDDRPPFAFVTLSGPVEITEDPDELVHWATVIAGRYMGPDRAEAYGRRNGVPGELLVRLTPDRIVGMTGVAD